MRKANKSNKIRFSNNKERLTDFVKEYLRTNDEKKVSITMICRELHISNNTFYNHYANLSELYEELAKEISHDFNQEMSQNFTALKEDDSDFLSRSAYALLVTVKKMRSDIIVWQKINSKHSLKDSLKKEIQKDIVTPFCNQSKNSDKRIILSNLLTDSLVTIVQFWISENYIADERRVCALISSYFKSTIECFNSLDE